MYLNKKAKLGMLFIAIFVLILIVLILALGILPSAQQWQEYTLSTSQTNTFSLHIFHNSKPLRLYILNDEQSDKTCAIYPYKNAGTLLRSVFVKTLKSGEKAFFDRFHLEGAYGIVCFDENEKLEPKWRDIPVILIKDETSRVLQFQIIKNGKLHFLGFINDGLNDETTARSGDSNIMLELNKKHWFVVINGDTNAWDFTIKLKKPLYDEYLHTGELPIKFYYGAPHYWPPIQPEHILILGPLSFEQKGEYPLALMDPACKRNCSKKTQITIFVN